MERHDIVTAAEEALGPMGDAAGLISCQEIGPVLVMAMDGTYSAFELRTVADVLDPPMPIVRLWRRIWK